MYICTQSWNKNLRFKFSWKSYCLFTSARIQTRSQSFACALPQNYIPNSRNLLTTPYKPAEMSLLESLSFSPIFKEPHMKVLRPVVFGHHQNYAQQYWNWTPGLTYAKQLLYHSNAVILSKDLSCIIARCKVLER